MAFRRARSSGPSVERHVRRPFENERTGQCPRVVERIARRLRGRRGRASVGPKYRHPRAGHEPRARGRHGLDGEQAALPVRQQIRRGRHDEETRISA